jgi:hypothetical protein
MWELLLNRFDWLEEILDICSTPDGAIYLIIWWTLLAVAVATPLIAAAWSIDAVFFKNRFGVFERIDERKPKPQKERALD